MGYVWCDGHVWDMCGVRYANNLLKNPATKRLSGKTALAMVVPGRSLGRLLLTIWFRW